MTRLTSSGLSASAPSVNANQTADTAPTPTPNPSAGRPQPPEGSNQPEPLPTTNRSLRQDLAPPNPYGDVIRLKEAPLEPTDLRFPINLATALRLSDARPLIVAAAQAGVWVAEAQLTRKKCFGFHR